MTVKLNEELVKYWEENYVNGFMCSLCNNSSLITVVHSNLDTTTDFCICPNGQTARQLTNNVLPTKSPGQKACVMCGKMLDCAVYDWSTFQPYGGGEISLHFGFGSLKFDSDIDDTQLRGIICDDCAEPLVTKMLTNKNPEER